MTGFTKLFSSILASTIWREDDKTRLVWITMLALADKNGVVEASIPGLADLAHVSVGDCEQALANLQKPDRYSRTPDNEGRRIRTVDGGWLILNHAKYRAKMSADERREYLREKQREHRARCQHGVNSAVDTSTLSTHTEAEASPSSEAKEKSSSSEQENCSDQVSVPPRKRIAKEPSEEACKLSALLKSEILRNKGDYKITPAQERKWAQTADRMLRIDERKVEAIADLIRWVQHDEFWMANVLSMDTLRKKFDELQLKQRGRANGKMHPPNGQLADIDYDRGLGPQNPDGSYSF